MTNREKILATFKREKIDRVVWQPRIEHWYNVNKKRETLPEEYRNKGLIEIYDALEASIRYYYGEGAYLKISYSNGADVKEEWKKNEIILRWSSPHGELIQRYKLAEFGYSWSPLEYPIKRIEDLKIMEYILRHRRIKFNYTAYNKAEKVIGDRGVIQFWTERSPLQRLILDYMGFENTIFALHDYLDKIEDFLKVIEETDDPLYEVIAECPCRIQNFGENIDSNLDSPPLYEEYLLPYYKKRVEQLHNSGKFCYIHMDGSLKPLLPYINKSGFDGIEAATPLPQGDVSLKELKDAMGDTILLDGIPAIMFLSYYSYRELEDFTLKVLGMFSPNLILGVSDELPPNSDIEKVKFVSKIVKDFKME
jgi:hypothetical protein